MSKTLAAINIIFAVADTIVCMLAILCFSYAAIHFASWWIMLFDFVPLAMFYGHGIIVDADIDEARKGEEDDESR